MADYRIIEAKIRQKAARMIQRGKPITSTNCENLIKQLDINFSFEEVELLIPPPGYRVIANAIYQAWKSRSQEENIRLDISSDDIYNLLLRIDTPWLESLRNVVLQTNGARPEKRSMLQRVLRYFGITKSN